MDNTRGLGIARVALTLQLTIAREKLDALLTENDKELGDRIAVSVAGWVESNHSSYYPALDFLVSEGAVTQSDFEALRTLAAVVRKRVKRDVQTQLWPVFSSVHIERAQSLCFLMPHLKPGRPDSAAELANYYFPNSVRLQLALSSLDKQNRLDDAVRIAEQKVLRNLQDGFETATTSAARLIDVPSSH